MRGSRQLSERRSAPWYGGADADPNQQSRRDLRLDLFRGLSLFFIFIDHIPNNVLSYVTLHSIAFSDAAEVFIFISGYAAPQFTEGLCSGREASRRPDRSIAAFGSSTSHTSSYS
jgi:OpgC protein